MASLTDDLMLLLLDDESGRPVVDGTRRDLAIAGTALLELAQQHRVSLSGPEDEVRGERILVRDNTPTGDAVLDTALSELERKPVTPRKAVERLGKDTREAVLDRLVERGLVTREDTRLLGVFRMTRWPSADVEHEAEIVRRINAVLTGGEEPDERTGGLIAMLHAADAVHKVADGDKSRLRSRAKEIAEGNWQSDAVQEQYKAMMAAVTAAGAAAVAAAAAGAASG